MAHAVTSTAFVHVKLDALRCMLSGLLEVTWAALLWGCLSASLAEEQGLPFTPGDVLEQLDAIINKQVITVCFWSSFKAVRTHTKLRSMLSGCRVYYHNPLCCSLCCAHGVLPRTRAIAYLVPYHALHCGHAVS